MAKFLPIPRIALIHNAVLKAGRESWDEGELLNTPLSRIRIEGGSNLTYTVSGEENRCDLTLFFDISNSRPKGINFVEGSVIKWQGNDYVIRKIEKCYTVDGEGLHHYELGLV